MSTTYYYNSPLDSLKIVMSEKGLFDLEYVTDKKKATIDETDQMAKKVKQQLDEYFAGERKEFDLPLHLEGTDFQKDVWRELIKIPYGETISYAELAKRVGNKNASRAVGNANGKNCIPIVIPCHRVVKSDGSLGGYSSGVARKEWLLKHELKFV